PPAESGESYGRGRTCRAGPDHHDVATLGRSHAAIVALPSPGLPGGLLRQSWIAGGPRCWPYAEKMLLDAVEARVVGCLVEKQMTTPQQYPLTLNSVVLACNQSSNRDPVVNYADQTVEGALSSLKQKGLVRLILPSHGRTVVRYRHVLDEKLGLDGHR